MMEEELILFLCTADMPLTDCKIYIMWLFVERLSIATGRWINMFEVLYICIVYNYVELSFI